MDSKTKLKNRTDVFVMLIAVTGVLIVLNMISFKVFGRIDLTASRAHTLSKASIEAARALDDVTVTAYISKKLPEAVDLGTGQEVTLKGVERAFRDKLEEYVAASDGHLKLVYADEDSPNKGSIEKQAEDSKVKLFAAKEAKIAKGQLEFTRYAMGAVFNYKNVEEVFPLALQPEFYEFETTKILVRLKEKYEKSLLMKDVLGTGKDLHESVKACNEKLKTIAEKKPEEGQDLALAAGKKDKTSEAVAGFKAAKADLDKLCGAIGPKLEKAKATFKGRSTYVDLLLDDVDQFSQLYGELGKVLAGQPIGEGADAQPAPPGAALQVQALMGKTWEEVDHDHTNLANSPGQKTIGVMCGHQEFCPFGRRDTLVKPELGMLMGQKNPLMQQIMQGAQQIEQAVNETNSRINEGLFVKRGFTIKQVSAGDPVPADLDALMIYAPRTELSEWDQYVIDQMLVRGKPVVVFAQMWDVALQNIKIADDLAEEPAANYNGISRVNTNLDTVLEKYGVKLERNLVLEKKNIENVRVTFVRQERGIQWQSQKDFAYPLLPVAKKFDDAHPLVRGIPQLSLPFASTVSATDKVKGKPGFEVVELVKTSPDAFVKDGSIPVLPQMVAELTMKEAATGPHTLALFVKGPFESAFKGKDIPKRPEKKKAQQDPRMPEPPEKAFDPEVEKRNFKGEGEGRLLVIGSNLGIEGLDIDRILEGFDMQKLGQMSGELIKDFQKWRAGFQNWQIRIGQVAHTLQDNLRFMANVLDWSTSQEALVEIRSKGYTRRPLEDVEPGQVKVLRWASILGTPLLLIAYGLLRVASRRKRNLALKV